MAKVDPRETAGRSGPIRTSSGTRVAVRVSPLAPEVTSLPGANDVVPESAGRDEPDRPVRDEMPTRELDLEQIRAMALRCASDVGSDEPGLHPASLPRPHLELVLGDEPDRASAAPATLDDEEATRPGRSASVVAAAVVLVALVVATFAALAVYGALP